MAEERLQKILAHAGLGSRRQCEELIAAGRVTVDGAVVTELGTKVDPDAADIRCDGERVRAERPAYYLLNKPRGVVCTSARSEGKPRAIDYIRRERRRLYTVGRLDEDSRGLIILTNDGELTQRLTHPRHQVAKTYRVTVRGSMSPAAVRKAREGIYLSEGKAALSRVTVRRRKRNATELEIELRQGINRQIRRVLARLGHPVTDLRRVAIGPIHDPELKEGAFRPLRPHEIRQLREAAGLEQPRRRRK
jgi:23S rRNA pseudouridine2605 synthase